MNDTDEKLTAFDLGGAIAPLRAKWGWIVGLGVIFLVTGFIALGSVVMATVASVYMVGIMMLISGVAEVIHAFQIKSWSKCLLWALLGVLYIVAGFVTFQNPLLAATLFTLVLGAVLVVSGIMRIVLAVNMQSAAPRGWIILSGCITLILGLLILSHWPTSSLYILGTLLAIDLIFAGIGWIGLGFSLRGNGAGSQAGAPRR
ncbi:HdeD family acid-resistance protein [Achromobacter aloeverae]